MKPIIITNKEIPRIKRFELSIFDGVFFDIKIKYEFHGLIELEKFKMSLLKLLDLYPFIGGNLINDNNNYFIDTSSPRLKIILYDDKKPQIISDNEYLFIVLLKKNENNTLLDLHINHIIGDGTTINQIIKKWNDIYQQKNIVNKNILERKELISKYKKVNIKYDNNLELYKNISYKEFNMYKLTECVFTFNKKEIKILKDKSESYSLLDALSAYLFIICNNIKEDPKFDNISTCFNFRKIINIDKNTFGNYVVFIKTKIINSNENIINISKKIRNSINEIDTDIINKCSNNIEFYRRMGKFEEYNWDIINKKTCFVTNSWTNFDMNKINFGLKIKKFTPHVLPIPYSVMYVKDNENIIVNISVPIHKENKLKIQY